MEQIRLEQLKKAANYFYLEVGSDAGLSDVEYDELVLEYGGKYKVLTELVEWDQAPEVIPPVEIGLKEKSAYKGNLYDHISKDLTGESEFLVMPKYDGCAIKAFYKRGILQKIISTPDESLAINRTKNLMNLFPLEIPVFDDLEVEWLRGEFLVDMREFGFKARNKANGLVNSKSKVEDINQYGYVRIYDVGVKDRDLNLKEKVVVLNWVITPLNPDGKGNYRFDRTKMWTNLSHPIEFGPKLVSPTGLEFQMDGVIVEKSNSDKVGYKFYYTDIARTRVTNITYNYTPTNGSYSAVINFEPVILEDKNISKCSAGSIGSMIERCIGVGSEIDVILSGGVIPKIENVISESTDFGIPFNCECGSKIWYENVCGSVLKCSDTANRKPCEVKVNHWTEETYQWILDKNDHMPGESVNDWLNRHAEFLGWLFRIDRYKEPKDLIGKRFSDTQDAIEGLRSYLSDLQCLNMDMNYCSGLEIIQLLSERKLP